jgi:hypothetical protein
LKLDRKPGGKLELSHVITSFPGIYDCIWIIRRPQGRKTDGILLRLVDIVIGEGLFFFVFFVLNATFNNISSISWRSVLLLEETGGSGENHRTK